LKKALGCLSMITPSAGIRSSAANQFLLGIEIGNVENDEK